MKKIVYKTMIFLLILGGIRMADYNVQMQERNGANTGWDNIYPVTKAENVIGLGGGGGDVYLDSTDPLADVIHKMTMGQAVTIGFWGDSTYWGHTSNVTPATQLDETPIETTEKILRAYYNNSNITCINYGVGGYATDDLINGFGETPAWSVVMASTTVDLAIVNLGINDAIGYNPSPEQYRANLRTIVNVARENDITIVLETPNVVLRKSTVIGSWEPAENVKAYAQIVRDVCRELNIPLIDNYKASEWYVYSKPTITETLPDGLHPSEALYKFIATQRVGLFVNSAQAGVISNSIIPCFDSAFKCYGTYYSDGAMPISKVGYCLFGKRINAGFYVEEDGLDLYLSAIDWANCSNAVTVVLDGTTIMTINMRDSNYSSTYPIDNEMLIYQKLAKGFHVLELYDNADTTTNRVACTYLKFRKNSKVNVASTASLSSYKTIKSIGTLQYTLSSTTEPCVLTDVVTSRLLGNIDIEFTATLLENEGFFVMGDKQSSNKILGGFVVIMGASNFVIGENTNGTTYNLSNSISSTGYINTSHVYRIVVTPAGAITVYIDGTSAFTYTMTRNLKGGYLGFYKNGAGTVTIKDIKIYE